MRKSFIPYSRPNIGKKEIGEVIDSLKSGWITTGPKVQHFEKKICDYLGCSFVVAVSSATAGLYLSLKALNFPKGKEVITTPFTFISTINMIVENGLKPVFVDINEDTLNLDENAIVEKITNNTVAIMPVHFAGQPANLDVIYNIAKENNLRVIEDAAHSFGSEYKDRKIGSFGDIQVFSFQATKNLTTGEGGCIVVNDEELATKLTKLRFHGIDKDGWKRFSKEGNAIYDVTILGGKYNMMDIQAAIGIHQIDKLDASNMQRKKLAEFYMQELKGIKDIILPKPVPYNTKTSWHLFYIRVKNKHLKRQDLVEYLKANNIGVGIHYISAFNFSLYKPYYPEAQREFPNAAFVSESILSLPLYPTLKLEEQQYIVNTIKSFFIK